jgi:hypothetical protein
MSRGRAHLFPDSTKKRQTARLRHAHLHKPYQITHKAFPTPAEKAQAGMGRSRVHAVESVFRSLKKKWE